MSKSFCYLYYHWVFATKLRRRFIQAETADELHAYMGGILRSLGGCLIQAGGIEDHRHLVISLPPTYSVAETVNKVKSGSTGWLRRVRGQRLFGWQNGYAAFTVSQSELPALLRYVANQENHHCRMSFRQELLQLLNRHGLKPDRRAMDRFCRRG